MLANKDLLRNVIWNNLLLLGKSLYLFFHSKVILDNVFDQSVD